ncbi:MAG TPA: glycerol-3-phosphate acyltransferase [Streptosporangiaceae bacterium]|nr:glycerol-3-phosphate acyltransferase [Streptosporangiaceae bacterium]
MGGPAFVVAGFALGAVPFGFLIGRASGIDVRRVGSGNIGAANLLRSVGRSAALLTLLLDIAKGALPVALARGAGLAPEWQAAVVAAASTGVWLATAALFRFTSLAALVAAALLPGLAWWLDGRRAFVTLAVALALLLVWRHRQNIERLLRGTEPRIGQRVATASQGPSA